MEHDMDEIARLPVRDRADLFRATAIARGDMTPALVEKDFWGPCPPFGGYSRCLFAIPRFQRRDESFQGFSGHRSFFGRY